MEVDTRTFMPEALGACFLVDPSDDQLCQLSHDHTKPGWIDEQRRVGNRRLFSVHTTFGENVSHPHD